MTTMPPIVSVDELDEFPLAVLIDVRWYLDGRSGRDAYESGHLPGALFVDLETQLSAHDQPATEGRHPFPSPEEFATVMGSIGVGDDTTVIAYDDTGGMTAGRLAVMLRMIGRNAAVLDGGIAAWHGHLMTGAGSTREPRVFTPCEWPTERLASADETAALALSPDGLVFDARSTGRFTGEITLIDPRPGHVPGAVSAPFDATIDPSTKRFRLAAELRDHFNHLGVSDSPSVVTYCGSGVSACVNILAMEHAGLPPARLFVASFSGWSSDAARDVELGLGR
jgi:thiosulfate/3-mercaptopyruvate sulfurtransferase